MLNFLIWKQIQDWKGEREERCVGKHRSRLNNKYLEKKNSWVVRRDKFGVLVFQLVGSWGVALF